jgi:sensor histidine kinase regulating citrate/malate metabolism
MFNARSQMTFIAVLVCLFAVGMSGLLNYFKYRSTADRLVKDRLVVTGSGIENSIRSSLALGLQFSDIGTLPETIDRERATDDLIRTIEVFDNEGQVLYSTDKLRAMRGVPKVWVAEARDAEGDQWMVKSGLNSAVGVPIKNSFGQVIGHVALRFDEAQLNESAMRVARELMAMTLALFAASSLLAWWVVQAVMSRMTRDLEAVEASLKNGVESAFSAKTQLRGPFGKPLLQFFGTVRHAEAQIALLRNQLGTDSESR